MCVCVCVCVKSTILVTCIQNLKLSKCKQHSWVRIYNLKKWVELNPIAYMFKGFCLHTVIFQFLDLKCIIFL